MVGSFVPEFGGSRESYVKNQLRKFQKFKQLIDLNAIEKQQYLACVSQANDCEELFTQQQSNSYFNNNYQDTNPSLKFSNFFTIGTL